VQYRTERNGVVETHVEKRTRIASVLEEPDDVDHDKVRGLHRHTATDHDKVGALHSHPSCTDHDNARLSTANQSTGRNISFGDVYT